MRWTNAAYRRGGPAMNLSYDKDMLLWLTAASTIILFSPDHAGNKTATAVDMQAPVQAY